MGILNVTPDSFSDGGHFSDPDSALARAHALVSEGADILDLGGESTRPGAQPVPEAEELRRVLPLVEALREVGVPLSVDTRKAGVMRAVLAAGADMINDVYALREPGALEAVAASRAAVCLMHMQGEPQTMQSEPRYGDVVAEVRQFLQQRAATCEAAGIERSRIVLDAGFGFGKSKEHNLTLLRQLRSLAELGWPLLAGLSRKSTLGALTGRPVAERMPGSIAAALWAVSKGAAIVRVHDVGPTVDALKVWTALTD
jgi:dihydropteroate synthase